MNGLSNMNTPSTLKTTILIADAVALRHVVTIFSLTSALKAKTEVLNVYSLSVWHMCLTCVLIIIQTELTKSRK